MRFVSACLSLVTLSGCVTLSEVELPLVGSRSKEDVSLEIRIGSTPHGKGDYEQYKLVPNGMFVECGVAEGGVSQTRQYGLMPISGATRSGLALLLSDLAEMQDSEPVQQSTNQGSLVQGTFSVQGEEGSLSYQISTLLKGKNQRDTLARSIIEVVRGTVEQPLCKRKEFLGLSRRKVQVLEE